MDQQELAAALGRKYDDNYKKALAEVEANQRKIAKQNEGYERSIDQHVKNLRKKIENEAGHPRIIHTVHGVGYRLDPAE